MPNTFSYNLTLVAIALCFLCGAILLRFTGRKHKPPRILAAYFLSLGLGKVVILLMLSGQIAETPHFFRTALIAAYLYPPLAYLYVRMHIRSKLYWMDLLLFVPLLFYIVDFSPFFLQSTQEKQALLERVMNDLPRLVTEHREGWLTPAWFHQIFRHVVSIFFWILSARLLYILFRVKQPGYYKENKVTLRWLSVFVILQFFFFAPAVLLMLTGHTEQSLNANYIPIVIMNCITCTYLFFQPVIFYGMPGVFYPLNLHAIRKNNEAVIEETNKKDGQPVGAPNRASEFKLMPKILPVSSSELVIHADLGYMTAEEVHQLGNMIGEYIESHQPYLDGGYDISSFAKDIGIPVRKRGLSG